jgi:hypothetical protein
MNTDDPFYQRSYAALVEFESAVASNRSRDVHRQIRWQRRRYTTRPPLGFKLVRRKDGLIYIEPDLRRLEIMVWSAQQFARGRKAREIALDLDRNRVPRMKLDIPKPKPGERRSKEFRYIRHPSGWDSASVRHDHLAWLRICRLNRLDPLTAAPVGQTTAGQPAMAGT